MFGWHLEKRKISDLTPYHKNPRQLSEKECQQLKRSIARFGLADKPIVNIDNVIIGGHQRLEVLKELGYVEIECWIPSHALDDDEMEEFNIRLNRNQGTFDWDILANQFDEEDLFEWGFDKFEIPSLKIDDKDSIASETNDEYCPTCNKKLTKKKHAKAKSLDGR